MYELKIQLILAGEKNKGEYISIDQVVKDDVEA